MIFLFISILGIALYIRDYKIPALFLFFFLLTAGFNLIPEKVNQLAFFSKGMDYAIIMLVGIVVIDTFCIKGYLKSNRLIYIYLLFCLFLTVSIIYNKFILGVNWTEIIRTVRYNFLWVVYLVFRNLSQAQLEKLLKYLFFATVACSVLYLLQIALDINILNEGGKSSVKLFGMKIPRFYNQPDMLHFFVFMAIYLNPYKGLAKYVTTSILVIALLGAFHRSLIGSFLFVLALGYILQLPRLKRVKILSVVFVASIFLVIFGGYMFVHSRTYIDIQRVASGNVADADIDIEDLQASTFTFRILHLMERNQYLLDNPKAMFLGAGLMTEDSKMTFNLFNFDVGLLEELSGTTNQLDSGDISYSVLLLRYGYLGTILNLSLFIYLTVVFYKKRENKFAFFSFLYFMLAISTSFFSGNFLEPITFVLPLITYSIIAPMKEEKSPSEDSGIKLALE